MKLRKLFFGYYPPTEDDFAEWWKTGLFVFDANALLDLYGLQDKTREEFFTFLELVKERLWVPHQAGLEFSKGRTRVIGQQVSKYKAVINRLDKLLPDMQARATEARNELDAPDVPEAVRDVAKRVSINFETLLRQAEEGTKSLAAEIAEIKKQLETECETQTSLTQNDPILEQLGTLLGDNVGDEYDAKDLPKKYAEGKARYEADPPVPPGYMDKGKKGNQIYGDLFVWFQTIDKAKIERKPILMINNEQKEDWVETRSDGKRVRRELIQEMYCQTQQPFFMYSLTEFMEAAKKYLGASFSNNALADASRVESEEIARQSISAVNHPSARTAIYEAFLSAWQPVDNHIGELMMATGDTSSNVSFPQALATLYTHGAISHKHYNRLNWLRHFRNTIVDDRGIKPPDESVRTWLLELCEIADELELQPRFAITAASNFLKQLYPDAAFVLMDSPPQIAMTQGQQVVAVDVEYVSVVNHYITSMLADQLDMGNRLEVSGNANKFILIAVCVHANIAVTLANMLSAELKVWIGYMEDGRFVPVTNFHSDHSMFN